MFCFCVWSSIIAAVLAVIKVYSGVVFERAGRKLHCLKNVGIPRNLKRHQVSFFHFISVFGALLHVIQIPTQALIRSKIHLRYFILINSHLHNLPNVYIFLPNYANLCNIIVEPQIILTHLGSITDINPVRSSY